MLKLKSNLNLLDEINNSIICKKSLLLEEEKINQAIKLIYKSLSQKGKIFFCGNGGSAADAQHLAAEFLIRLRPKINRMPLPALSLSMDPSTMTACGNDYSFDKIFSRPFEALSNKNDILIVISTSGNSKNILEVLKIAKKNNIKSLGLLGTTGGKAKKLSSLNIIVKNTNVARIQESHIFLGHYILQKVEDLIIKEKA
jgi:D-sedoheptulose 7-phosphate isomerase|tara:strand:- start:1103 stop:1699 length:597 start_codon:yes stop_codon:yes gene_type:complete